jgi:hypothetical protein
MANQGAQRPDGQFFVLRNRKIDPNARLNHHQMTAYLTDWLPAGLLESLDRVLPRVLLNLPIELYHDHNRLFR